MNKYKFDEEYFLKIHSPAATERQAIFCKYAKLIGLGHGKVLDIGCGEGGMLAQLEQLGWQGWGVDISSFALKQAKRLVKSKLRTLDVAKQKLPFEDEMFDVVIAMDIVEHVKHDELLFVEIARVLKPGGQVLITTPNKFSWYWRIFRTRLPHDPTHNNEHSLEYWVGKLAKNGLKVNRKLGVVVFGWPPGLVWRRRLQKFGLPVVVGPVMWPFIEWSGTLVIGASKIV